MNSGAAEHLKNAARRAFGDCLAGVNTESFHQPTVLLLRQFTNLLLTARPLVGPPGIQTFIQEHEAVTFLIQRFDSISTSAAEQEKGIIKWTQLKVVFHQLCQTIDLLAHIGVTTGHIYFRAGRYDHPRPIPNARIARSSVIGSAPL